MTIKFEIILEIDQDSINKQAVEAVEDAILNSLPGVAEYGKDDAICIDSTIISYIEPIEKIDTEKIMKQWDAMRKRIAEGDKSSAPFDWFASVIDSFIEQCPTG